LIAHARLVVHAHARLVVHAHARLVVHPHAGLRRRRHLIRVRRVLPTPRGQHARGEHTGGKSLRFHGRGSFVFVSRAGILHVRATVAIDDRHGRPGTRPRAAPDGPERQIYVIADPLRTTAPTLVYTPAPSPY